MNTELLNILFEQLPVVIVLSLAIYIQLKEKRNLIKEAKKERQQHQIELKDLNKYIRDSEKENLSTLQDLVIIIENIETTLQKFYPNEK